ncbi:uncharacterized protein LOC142342647 [Convolutriloba macropyga]|uniref:uncharacterized protein LOC142342647 n=1 Tax=Convolutriloba macropyga TaxID=536237 RepID=UPI003F5201A3
MKLHSSKLEFTFDVLIESLSDVPRLQGSIQCKLRLLGAKRGSLLLNRRLKDDRKVITEPVKIENHQAQFNSSHSFVVQMSTDGKAVLRSQIMRVSVKFIDTNNSQKKLGYSDINLAELCPGENTRKPLLTGYRNNKKERQDNSRIILRINMRLTRGDPMSFLSAGTEYNSYNLRERNVIDILNPNATATSVGAVSAGGGSAAPDSATIHSTLAPPEGGGSHSRNPSANVDFPLVGMNPDHHRHLSTNSVHSRQPSQTETSSMYNYNFSYNTTSIATIGNRHSMASATIDTLPPTSSSAVFYHHNDNTLSSAASNPSLILRNHPSGTTTCNSPTASENIAGSGRLGGVAEDAADALAPTRRNNRALVDSLFKEFSTVPESPD